MEFCAGGDLSHFIRTRKILPEKVARLFLQQLACALKFLHDRNISHLDLKPQNILLSSVENPHLKLADFGFAQYMSPWDEKHMLRGSPLYMAPEMVCHRQYDARVDLWSVGVILYEALFGRPPFFSKSFAELEEKIRSNRVIELPCRPRLSQGCRDLLQRLLERDPLQRISFEEFFTHPFVDMEHMPSAESLCKATALVVEAVKKDEQGDPSAALSLYCKALEFFVPALHYETDARRKEAIRSKVGQYISRAEELKTLVTSNNKTLLQQGNPARNILKEMSRDKPRLCAALEVASAAMAKEEEGKEDSDTLDLYQQSLGELLLMLAEPVGRRRELLHSEIQTLMGRAEYLKEQIKVPAVGTRQSSPPSYCLCAQSPFKSGHYDPPDIWYSDDLQQKKHTRWRLEYRANQSGLLVEITSLKSDVTVTSSNRTFCISIPSSHFHSTSNNRN
ncbi:Serine/threonine-protein kinase ULK3 [Chelonia mydas]|uniref:Serine/threonine-protein kinase ULK3 n=1 Tax=Chelonia mydas TaxID=8469 RepID=M7B3W6_CHEMY|nr:Serine/threonine-protein kinase ULK3 [Chelonia mydas]